MLVITTGCQEILAGSNVTGNVEKFNDIFVVGMRNYANADGFLGQQVEMAL